MSEDLSLAAYDRPVPRYTSYPTAAHFGARVGPDAHARWLSEIDGDSANLYLHVPFCAELCWYCACHTMAMRREGTLNAYADSLLRELELVAARVPDLVVDSIQWGGGTPSQLGVSRLLEVARRIAALFDRRSGAEVSMEVDPRHCTAELAEAMAQAGVTRASLGVQDFDEQVQAAINRPQSFATTAEALVRLREAGIERSNIDLVYGLPRQTLDTLARTLDQAIALAPDRFAVFAYAHVPWMKPHQKLIAPAMLPDGPTRAAMAKLVADRLVAAGYAQAGLDHYARERDTLARAAAAGTLRRTFQGYVADASPWVIGIGASAISSLPACRLQSERRRRRGLYARAPGRSFRHGARRGAERRRSPAGRPDQSPDVPLRGRHRRRLQASQREPGCLPGVARSAATHAARRADRTRRPPPQGHRTRATAAAGRLRRLRSLLHRR